MNIEPQASPLLQRMAQLPNRARFTDDQIALLYNTGCNLFDQGKYREAAQLFEVACFYRPLATHYLYACGLARQALKDYAAAIPILSSVGMLWPQDPRPPLQLAECHLALGQAEVGVNMLHLAVALAGQDPQHRALLAYAERLLAAQTQASQAAQAARNGQASKETS